MTHEPRFDGLGLDTPLLDAIHDAGYERPTSVQSQAIPPALEGRDVLGCAQTGTGKTAAFALPILQQLAGDDARPAKKRRARALILSPTRELAAQIGTDLEGYGQHLDVQHAVIYGGVRQHSQVRALRGGVDILVATPGRLWDLFEQGHLRLADIEIFVLDEADRMLDQGFLPVVRRILRELPRRRQTLFFSATMPQALRPLADDVLTDPAHVQATPASSTPERVDESVYFVHRRDKRALLQDVLGDDTVTRAIVFTRTKRGADRVAHQLQRGDIQTAAIHGDKSQQDRQRILARFRKGGVRVLVATDVASRGIDIDDVSHVINFDLPDEPEAYVHRIGRTARAGAKGAALSFCSAEDLPSLTGIERLLSRRMRVVDDHHYATTSGVSAPSPSSGMGGGKGGRRRRRRLSYSA